MTSIMVALILLLLQSTTIAPCQSFGLPFLDGGAKDIPKLYEGYFNNQIAKQSSAAVGAAISNGKTSIEVNLPSVPNLEEVRFGYVL